MSRLLIALLLSLGTGCSSSACGGAPTQPAVPGPETRAKTVGAEEPIESPSRKSARREMVESQLETRDIRDPRVLAAMHAVPRHLFVPDEVADSAYEDSALPIGHDQTISQPYVVALMTQLGEIEPGDRVLEVGTGSGYQAAVLATMGAEVYSIEIVEPLANRARATLDRLGYDVTVRHGDGYRGWPEHAPFDAILVTAAPPEIPAPLKVQLAVGGKLVVPVGQGVQDLLVLTRTEMGFEERNVLPVMFVPMTGEAEQKAP